MVQPVAFEPPTKPAAQGIVRASTLPLTLALVRNFLYLRGVAALIRLQRQSRHARDRGAFLACGREDRAFRLRGQNETLITVGNFHEQRAFREERSDPALGCAAVAAGGTAGAGAGLVLLVFMMAGVHRRDDTP